MAIHNKSHHNHALMSLNKTRKDRLLKHEAPTDFVLPEKPYVCLNIMDCCEFLRQIPDNSIQLICIDPPYNLALADWDNYPTQKPVEVVERFVKAFAYPGSVVLDFFAGSGTVGRACISNGRHCLMCDNDEATIGYFNKHLEQMRAIGQKSDYTRIESVREFFEKR